MIDGNSEKPEILVSIDGEFTGKIPGAYSMISLGAAAYSWKGTLLSTFKVNMTELWGSSRDAKTMEWWAKFPEAWQMATEDAIGPKEGMENFRAWLQTLPGRPKLMGWPLPVDFMFVYWYYVNFLGEEPLFGYDGIDIKTYAMAQLKIPTLSETTRTLVKEKFDFPLVEFSHDPVDDAIQQADLFFALNRYAKKHSA